MIGHPGFSLFVTRKPLDYSKPHFEKAQNKSYWGKVIEEEEEEQKRRKGEGHAERKNLYAFLDEVCLVTSHVDSLQTDRQTYTLTSLSASCWHLDSRLLQLRADDRAVPDWGEPWSAACYSRWCWQSVGTRPFYFILRSWRLIDSCLHLLTLSSFGSESMSCYLWLSETFCLFVVFLRFSDH